MRVLITGASGFVGRYVLLALLRAGHDPVGWAGHADTASGLEVVDLLQPLVVVDDDLQSVDAVIHLAGLASVSASYRQPARYVTANPTMLIHLCEGLLKAQAFPLVVVVSTGAVYRASSEVITEESALDPANPYSIGKLAQEHVAAYYRGRGLPTIIARPFNHVGSGQTLGYLFPDLISQIVRIERTGQGVLTAGNLSSRRDYTDVRDVARAYVELIERGSPGETYNICSQRSLSGFEVLDMARRLAGGTISVEQQDSRLSDVPDVRASSQKLHDAVGWSPRVSIETTVKDVVEEWRARLGVSALS